MHYTETTTTVNLTRNDVAEIRCILRHGLRESIYTGAKFMSLSNRLKSGVTELDNLVAKEIWFALHQMFNKGIEDSDLSDKTVKHHMYSFSQGRWYTTNDYYDKVC